MRLLFTVASFLSAFLLFSVQPLVGKMFLPLFGGTPAVWNTCLVFFQMMLLLGYLYAHILSTRISEKLQFILHLSLIILVLYFLPIHLPPHPLLNQEHPLSDLLKLLCITVGLPFFAVSTNAPLFQKWFSKTNHRLAHDPYFLYSASNTGSLLALLSYPLIIEPLLTINLQTHLWAAAYALLILLIILCMRFPARSIRQGAEGRGFLFFRTSEPAGGQGCPELARGLGAARDGRENEEKEEPSPLGGVHITDPPCLRQLRLRWFIFALLPSSLMLSVTTYISTDIASIPLLWVIPLSLYLITFILAFSGRQFISDRIFLTLFSFFTLPVFFTMLVGAVDPVLVVILLHLTLFFFAALYCHTELAKLRPQAEHLTEFYLWLSFGGMCGGLFNTLLAPYLFTGVYEYPLAIILISLLRPPRMPEVNKTNARVFDFLTPIFIGLLTYLLVLIARGFSIPAGRGTNSLIFVLPVVLTYLQRYRPLRFSLCLVALLFASLSFVPPYWQTVYAERNFFGVLRVSNSRDGRFRYLVHGTTLHGKQWLDESQKCEPLGYYHRLGPLSSVFDLLGTSSSVAVVGLGAATIVCYALPEQPWTFYEINPAVVQIAYEKRFFRFLGETAARNVQVVLGDGRLQLQSAADHSYDMIILDAFSSDTIPSHLLTREALQLYLNKLSTTGILLFHISNRTFNLAPLLAALAKDAKLSAVSRFDHSVSREDAVAGKDGSHWVVMTNNVSVIHRLTEDKRWKVLSASDQTKLWRDDFSNVLSAVRWK